MSGEGTDGDSNRYYRRRGAYAGSSACVLLCWWEVAYGSWRHYGEAGFYLLQHLDHEICPSGMAILTRR